MTRQEAEEKALQIYEEFQPTSGEPFKKGSTETLALIDIDDEWAVEIGYYMDEMSPWLVHKSKDSEETRELL